MLRANLRGPRGRVKRWDYWCVITPDVVASFTYADIDYAGLANCWVLDRHDHRAGNDDYRQPGDLFRLMTDEQRERLAASRETLSRLESILARIA